MHLDVIELRRFYYRTRLGGVVQRSLRSALAALLCAGFAAAVQAAPEVAWELRVSSSN